MPRHIEPPLLRCVSYSPSLTLACSSFLSAWAKSIHHVINSVLLLVPFKSYQIRKTVDFFIMCNSLNTSWHQFPPVPLLYWFPLMHHGKGVSQICLVFCFVYILFDVLKFMFLIELIRIARK